MVKLHLQMNTDDDCEIHYKDRSYCFYGENLDAMIEGLTVGDCVCKLLSDIVIGDGKAAQFTKAWLFDAINSLMVGDDPVSCSGNQEYGMWIKED
jgi:hypothetical protein